MTGSYSNINPVKPIIMATELHGTDCQEFTWNSSQNFRLVQKGNYANPSQSSSSVHIINVIKND